MRERTLIGATMAGGEVVIIGDLEGSVLCGRWRARGVSGEALIVTSANDPTVPPALLAKRLALDVAGVAALASIGPIERDGVPVAWGLAEHEPAGLPASSAAGTLAPRAVAQLGAALADVVAAAHAATQRLTALHPSTVFVDVRGAEIVLSGVMPRCLDFLAQARRPRPYVQEILEPWFGAPERLVEAAVAASDVYDCALVVGFLATARWPWGDAGTPRGEWLERALGSTESPYAGLPAAFADIEAAIAPALVRQPEKRPDASTLARWLRSMCV